MKATIARYTEIEWFAIRSLDRLIIDYGAATRQKYPISEDGLEVLRTAILDIEQIKFDLINRIKEKQS